MFRRFLLPLVLLLLAAASAPAREIPLTAPQYGPAPNDQYDPVVASNGTGFLVTWLDWRGGIPTVYAARVRPDGSVLDATGIRIAAFDLSTANTRILGVFRTSGAYVVLFATQRFLPDGASQWETYVALVGDDGTLVEPAHLITKNDQPFVAASNGSRILMVNHQSLTLLSERGEILQEGIALPGPGLTGGPIASNGSTFLMLASAAPFDNITFVALDANGAAIGSSRVAVRSFGNAVVGSDGADYLVLYNNGVSAATQTQVVTANGALGASGTIPGGGISTERATLLWTGSDYLLASTMADATQELASATLTRSGALAAGPARLGIFGTPGAANFAAAAWNGSRALFARPAGTQEDARGLDIAGVVVDGTGAPLTPPVTISTSANLQVSPAIGTGGANDLVAWLEPGGLYAARVTRDGTVLDPHGIFVAANAARSRDLLFTGLVVPPRVVFDGLAYVVVWGNSTGLYAQRIDPITGVLLGAQQTLLTSCVFFFDIGRDSNGLAVFAATCSGSVALRVGLGGAVGAPVPIPVSSGRGVGSPAAAWNGTEWLVVFRELIPLPSGISPPPTRGNLHALRLSPAFTPLDAQPIDIAVSDDDEQAPLVATNGADFLVTWTHFGYSDGTNVRGRVVHANGAVDAPLVFASDGSTAADMVWDGARFAIALVTPNADRSYSIWLTHAGSGDRVPISTAPTARPDVALAAVPGAPLRAVYDRTAPEPVYGGVWRVFLTDVVSGRRRATTLNAIVP